MKNRFTKNIFPFAVAVCTAASLPAAETVTLAGHDEALVAVMQIWAAGFAKQHPDFAPLVVTELPAPKAGQGALDDPTAPPLSSNLLRFGPTAWTISARERTEFALKNGRPPLELTVGFGAAASKGKPHAIGIFVHPENPLRGLTLPQVDAVFSAERRRGYREIKTWGDLGLTGEWAAQPVHATGRRLNNTVASSLREVLLRGADFKPDYKEAADSVAVVAAVAGDRYAIGFFGLGFATAEVKSLALAENEGGPLIVPNEASVAAGTYPLRRDFCLLLDWPSDRSQVNSVVRKFVQYLFSTEAQATLATEGFYPLPSPVLFAELAKLK